MDNTRWYDKDNYTRLLMTTLEQVDENARIELASDLIQIIFQSNLSSNLDKLIENANNEDLPVKRRWYDRNEALHSTVEIIKYISKSLNGNDKKDLMREFFYSVISLQETMELRAIEVKS